MKIKKRYVIGIVVAVIAICFIAFKVFRKPEHTGPTPDEIVKELLEFDKNGDGQLSKDELSERMQGLITRGDANQDGILNHDELLKLAEAQSAATQDKEREGKHRRQAAEK